MVYFNILTYLFNPPFIRLHTNILLSLIIDYWLFTKTLASHVHIYLLNGYHRFYVHLYVDMDQCVLNSPLGHSTLLDKVLMEHLMSTSMIRWLPRSMLLIIIDVDHVGMTISRWIEQIKRQSYMKNFFLYFLLVMKLRMSRNCVRYNKKWIEAKWSNRTCIVMKAEKKSN